MTKKYANLSLVYAIIALISGVFYREFTKFFDFTGKSNLSIIHTHYFMLGMVFFLLLMLLEKNFSFSSEKNTGKVLLLYNIGLNTMGLTFLVRGITQVFASELSKAMNSAISGIAGLGHIFLAISLILLLLKIKKKA